MKQKQTSKTKKELKEQRDTLTISAEDVNTPFSEI
jgi:hypothetical protein